MFGYTIVPKIYIKRLKEELALVYEQWQKQGTETGDHGVDWDLDRNQPMWITMGDQIEAQEQIIAVLTGENEELKLQLEDSKAFAHALERKLWR